MPSPRKPDPVRRALRWLWPTALLAVAPKCLLCLLAYAGLGAALGLGNRELCGAPTDSPLSWPTALAWLGAAGALGSAIVLIRHRPARLPATT
jgi:hypothetical protein